MGHTETAYLNSETYGFGFDDLKKYNRGWVLSAIRFEIKTFPQWRDTIVVRTWPSGCSKLFAFRDFLVEDGEGNVILRATSNWVLLNIENRTPSRMSDLHEPLPTNTEKQALEGHPKRLNRANYEQGELIHSLEVPYSAIDINGHVNNTQYFAWTLDALRKCGVDLKTSCKIEATYMSEVFEGDTVEFYKLDREDGLFVFAERKGDEGGDVFAVQILFD